MQIATGYHLCPLTFKSYKSVYPLRFLYDMSGYFSPRDSPVITTCFAYVFVLYCFVFPNLFNLQKYISPNGLASSMYSTQDTDQPYKLTRCKTTITTKSNLTRRHFNPLIRENAFTHQFSPRIMLPLPFTYSPYLRFNDANKIHTLFASNLCTHSTWNIFIIHDFFHFISHIVKILLTVLWCF